MTDFATLSSLPSVDRSETQGLCLVRFNERSWFDLDQLIQNNQGFFYGCLKHKRDAITKRNIPEDHFVFVSATKKGMTVCSQTYKRAKILISEEWVKNNVPKMMDQPERQPSRGERAQQRRSGPKAVRKATGPKRAYRDAPEPITLEDHELFRDLEGNVVHVDVRGERNEDRIWFRCSDIEKLFEMENLSHYINQTLTESEDYETFLLSQYHTIHGTGLIEDSVPQRRERVLFLSFNGLMRVIFASRSGVANRYRVWAIKICYAGLFGTEEQRVKAASEVVGVPTSSLKDIFEVAAVKVPCLYLFYIGKVVDLRKHYDELKDHKSGMLFKFGRTDNLLRRCKEHIKTYGSLKDSNLRIRLWVPIDPKHLSTAETEISRFLTDKKVRFQNHDETVVLSLRDIKPLKEEYGRTYRSYGIATTEVEELRDRVKEMKWVMTHNEETIQLLNKTISDLMARETHWLKDKENHERERQEWVKDKGIHERERDCWNFEKESLIRKHELEIKEWKDRFDQTEKERRHLMELLLQREE